jgi:hypothetical protein
VIVSLYSINLLVYVTEMECIYCAVRVESLNVFQINLWHQTGLAVAHAVSNVFEPRLVHVRFVVNKVALRQGFLRILRFCPVSIKMVLTQLYLNVPFTRRTNGRIQETFQKAVLFGNRGALD